MAPDPNTDKYRPEQRLNERFSMLLPVRISTQGSGGKEVFFESITANISSGGVFISTTDPLPVASKVYLEFLIDFEDLKKLRFILSFESLRNYQGKPVWVNVSGIVIRHQEDGMAIIYDDDYQLSPIRTSETE
ncbi:MAG: hypothetical protein HKP41_00085 [Desulfobacterales bacterium]|nr:PilZ domain-containing protein [Deltaproteobacteria bacterium]NNK92723.1 hypothetical protein [Desulfobacterales bacterium]